MADRGLTPPRNVKIAKTDKIKLSWDTSYAGDEPVAHYEIIRDGEMLETIQQTPRVSKVPFTWETASGREFRLVAVECSWQKSSNRNNDCIVQSG